MPRWSLRALLILLALSASVQAADLDRHEVVVDGHPFAVWSKVPELPRSSMLLVHGRTWSARPDFDLQVPGESLSLMDGLVELGVAAYAVDLRGYGATPRDPSGWLTPDRAARDLAGVLAWLAGQSALPHRPYLFGWSYGSMLAQLVAQRHPNLVAGIVLFGYPVRPGIDRDPLPLPEEPPREANTAAAAASDFITPGSISARAVQAFVDAALAADPVRVDWRELDQWRELDPTRVGVPTLLLQGEHDPLARDDVHADLFARLDTPDKAWVVLPGGDHAAFMETPRDYFLSAMDAFVHRSPARRSGASDQLHAPQPAD
jgi:pimeloyl-ACP methyl ester carboxylesterase